MANWHFTLLRLITKDDTTTRVCRQYGKSLSKGESESKKSES